jgi:hypothetical protein
MQDIRTHALDVDELLYLERMQIVFAREVAHEETCQVLSVSIFISFAPQC